MRKKGLDILRAIAVILVLFRHSDLDNSIRHFGWLGVDLFFVLSGFLISNILFAEHKKYGHIKVKRFLIRRGFKIFLPFYFFMFSTLLFNYFYNSRTYEWTELISELFYLQSYVPNIWIHTWSLAVEEHFYLLFSITVLLLSRKEFLGKRGFIISSLIFLLLLSFLMRFNVSYPHRDDNSYGFVKTHLRSDGIIFGVLLSYLYNFTGALKILLKSKWIVFISSCLLIAPGFFFKGGGFFMNTIGLTTVNAGFSLLVLLSLDIEKYLNNYPLKFLKIPVNLLCLIGINSYSIYLWHINSKKILYNNLSFDLPLVAASYILLSILLGILMSYLIEKPSLRLRDYTIRKIRL